MSKTHTTGYTRVYPGQQTQLNLSDYSRYLSARVRWRGVANPYWAYSTKSDSGISATIPYPDAGWSVYYCAGQATVVIRNNSAYDVTVEVRVSIGGTVYGASQTYIPPGGFAQVHTSSGTIYANLTGQTVSWSVHRISGSGDINSEGTPTASATLAQTQQRTQHTLNPRVTVGALSAQHTGELTEGQVSGWYTLNGLVKGNNTLTHQAANSNVRADVEVEYTVEPYLPYTEQEAPAHGSGTADTTVGFVFTLTAEPDNSAEKYHARIRIDNYSAMPAPEVYESKGNQTGWHYWTGSAWAAFPAEGVNPGTRVRYTKAFPLTTIYWDTASHDGYNYGRQTTPYKVRVVLSTDDLYALQIDGTPYDALTLRILEASNGELGGVVVTVDNKDGAAMAAIDFGDTLAVALHIKGEDEDFEAVVRELRPVGGTLEITAVTGDGILAERLCKQDYAAQDIGVTVAAIINTYCAPLTAAGVDTATGFVAPVQANGKSPLAVLEELRRNYGLYYYMDKNWDLHMYKPGAVSDDATLNIRYEVVT